MKYVVLVLVFPHLYSQFSFQKKSSHQLWSEKSETNCNDKCNCSVGYAWLWLKINYLREHTIECYPDIEITYTDHNKEAEVRCRRPNADQSVVSGLRLPHTFKTVKIEGCSLPNSSFSVFLASMGVHLFDMLSIYSYSGSLRRKHFESLDKINELKISQSDLGVLSLDLFEELTNLDTLTIQLSSLSLKEGIFRYNTKLKRVFLDRNNISEVSLDVFHNLTNLSYLEIVGTTNISTIFDVSKHAPPLDHLILKSVIIKPQPHALEQSKLPLEENTIAVLPKRLQEILQSTKMVEIVLTNISPNTLQLEPACFANLPTLKSVTVSANNLKFVPEDAFSKSINIEILDLNNNSINTFAPNTFSDLGNLVKLNISNNQLSHLPEGLLSRTKSLTTLDLRNNLLKYIEP